MGNSSLQDGTEKWALGTVASGEKICNLKLESQVKCTRSWAENKVGKLLYLYPKHENGVGNENTFHWFIYRNQTAAGPKN